MVYLLLDYVEALALNPFLDFEDKVLQ